MNKDPKGCNWQKNIMPSQTNPFLDEKKTLGIKNLHLSRPDSVDSDLMTRLQREWKLTVFMAFSVG